MSSLVRLVFKFSDYLKYNLFAFNRIEPMFALNLPNDMPNDKSVKSIIDEIMANGLVLAVPKQRRTIERRLKRRFGVPNYPDSCPIIRPKENITVCDNCGNYHELHTLCTQCYDKVRKETQLIQESIKKQFNIFEPIEQEVEIRYKEDERNDENLGKKRIVEIDRQRPEWFAKNLLSKSIKSKKWTETNVILKEKEPKIKD